MQQTRTVSVPRLAVDPDKLGYFRFGRLAGGVVLSTELGEWHHLDEPTFRVLLAGELGEDHPEHAALAAKGIVRSGVDPEHLANAMRRRKRFVGVGPAVHVLHLAGDGRALTVEKAKDILDFAMLSTSAALELRLVPGPTVDLDLLGFIVQYATEKNRYEGKALSWRLDVDPARLDDAAVAFLVDKRFRVRATLRGAGFGPATLERVGALQQAATAKKRDPGLVEVDLLVDAEVVGQLTATAEALREHGVRRFRARPVLHGEGAVARDAWAAAYRGLLRRLLALAEQDVDLTEETAATLVTAATRTDAAPDVEVRSPGASGTVVYDVDGRIYPAEAARQAPDPDMFTLGTAGVTSYKETTTHGTLRALTVASLLECLPGFADHWATPFLGVDPVGSWATAGDLFPKAPSSAEVLAQLACVEAVFEVLVAGGGPAEQLVRWAQG